MSVSVVASTCRSSADSNRLDLEYEISVRDRTVMRLSTVSSGSEEGRKFRESLRWDQSNLDGWSPILVWYAADCCYLSVDKLYR